MGFCDICGKQTKTRSVYIEGAELQACYNCYKGSDKERKSEKGEGEQHKKEWAIKEREQYIVDSWADDIRKGMKNAHIDEKELAKKIGISESYMKHILNGEIKPEIKIAKKIEQLLKIKLIEEIFIEGSTEKVNIASKTLEDNIDWEGADNGG